MDFSWTDEQLALRRDAVRFATSRLNEGVAGDDARMRFPREKWDELGSWGYFGLPVPEAEGGAGVDLMTALLVTEGLGEGCLDGGLVFSAVVQLWDLVVPLWKAGSTDQKLRYLPGLMDGSLVGAIAVTEPDAGSDAFSMTTSAARADGGWRLHGAKMFITNGPVADVVLVFARTGTSSPIGSISAFLVTTSSPGVTAGPAFEKMGLRTSPVGELAFDDVFVPDEDVVGKVGMGMEVFKDALEWERIFGLAMYLGALERELAGARRYVRERTAFGQPIGKFQSVANRLVDMKLRLETSRLLVYRAGWNKATGRNAGTEAAMAKLWLSECAVASSLDAIQVRGGYGYLTESGVERMLRDAVGSRIYAGTSEVQRTIIARGMGV